MLDIAEKILSTLANLLNKNGWSIEQVFGQPKELIYIVPGIENDKEIKLITSEKFLGRLD